MRDFYMYLCDTCGFSRDKPGVCPSCQNLLTEYSKESQYEYQTDMEEAMRSQSLQKWYV